MTAAAQQSPIRVAIYTRISADHEGEQLGVRRQQADCLTRADRERWQVVAEYSDNDIGASTKSRKKTRPDYSRLLADARSGAFDLIVAYSNSRLTRRPLELEDLIQLYEQTGVCIKTIVSGDDDLATADGRMVARIKASVDAAEAERISERAKRSHKANADSGRMKVGRRPFGYTEDGMELVPAEAELLKEGIARLIAGASMYSIRRYFDASGIPTSAGNRWSNPGLKSVLARWRNAGIAVYQGQPVAEGDWPAICSREDLELVMSIIDQPRATYADDKGIKHVLSGAVMVCGVCGGRVRATSSGTYQCSERFCVAIGTDKAEDFVLDRVAFHLAEEGLPMVDDRVTARIRTLQGELAEVSADEAELVKAKLSIHVKLQLGEELAARRETLEAELGQLRRANARQSLVASLLPSELRFGQTVGHIKLNAQTVKERLLSLRLDEQRAVIEGIFSLTLLPSGRGRKLSPADRIKLAPWNAEDEVG